MIDNLTLALSLISILGSAITVWLAYKIYKFNRLSKGWIAVTVAFVLIIFRRCLGFLNDYGMYPDMKDEITLFANLLQIVISLDYIWGFWNILKDFESFNLAGKQCAEKASAFNRKKKR